jgi:hypothetical protein
MTDIIVLKAKHIISNKLISIQELVNFTYVLATE